MENQSGIKSLAEALSEPLAAILTSPQFLIVLRKAFADSIASSGVSPPDVPTTPPLDAFFRVKQIVGDPKANPPIPGLLPISRSGFLAGVATGKYPKGMRLSSRIVVWRASDIAKLMDEVARGQK